MLPPAVTVAVTVTVTGAPQMDEAKLAEAEPASCAEEADPSDVLERT